MRTARILEVLRCVATGRPVDPRAGIEALLAFQDLAPSLKPVPHYWCTCGHEHSHLVANDLPVDGCVYVYCACPGFTISGEHPPTAEEKLQLRERDRAARAKYDAKQRRARKRATP